MTKIVKNTGKYQDDQEDYSGGGGGGVTSFNSRTGAVTPQSGDYDTSQISTSINGLVKGNGSALSSASSGTDYAPATSGTGILKGNGSGGFTSGAAFADLTDFIAWTDYSGTSTITGFSAYTSKQLQYVVMGKTMIVLFDIRSTANNGSGNATSFTLPYNSSSWAGDQVFLCRTQNSTTQATGMGIITSGTNTVNFYTSTNTGTLNSWTNAATRHIQGMLIVNIA